MSVVLRAGDAPAASRLDYWTSAVSDVVGPHEVRAPHGIDPADTLVVRDMGAVVVGQLSAARPAWVSRSRSSIGRTVAEIDLCKVHVLVEGHGVVRQDGREARLGPGDLTLIDLSRPASWAMAPMRCIAVGFPRALLPLPADSVGRLTAVRIPGDRGWGGLASSLTRELPRYLDEGSPAGQARLGVAVLDLLTVALADRIDASGQVPGLLRYRYAQAVRPHRGREDRGRDP